MSSLGGGSERRGEKKIFKSSKPEMDPQSGGGDFLRDWGEELGKVLRKENSILLGRGGGKKPPYRYGRGTIGDYRGFTINHFGRGKLGLFL